jgi:hypothetical protein
MLLANRRLEPDGSHLASALVAIALRQIATVAVPHKKQPILQTAITDNHHFYLLLLQGANISNDGFRVVCGQCLYRARVLRGSGYGASQIGIRLFLFIVRNKARSLHRGLACGIRAVAGYAFCFVESGSVVLGIRMNMVTAIIITSITSFVVFMISFLLLVKLCIS